jgi:hypothetical protein
VSKNNTEAHQKPAQSSNNQHFNNKTTLFKTNIPTGCIITVVGGIIKKSTPVKIHIKLLSLPRIQF